MYIYSSTAVSYEKVYKSYLPGQDSSVTPELVMFLPPSHRSSSAPSSSSTHQHTSSTRTPSSSPSSSATHLEHSATRTQAASVATSDGGSVAGSASHDSTAAVAVATSDGTSRGKGGIGEIARDKRRERVNSSSSIGSAALPVDDALVPEADTNKHAPSVVGGATVQIQASTATGIMPGTPVSLFHDPLLYYSPGSGTSVPGNENTGTYQDGGSDVTLNYFPALRANVDMETGQNTDGCNELVSLGNDPVMKREIEPCDVKSHMTSDTVVTAKSPKPQEADVVSATDEQESGRTSPSFANEEFENTDHNRYRSSESSAMPENWPDVQTPKSPLKEDSVSPVGEHSPVSRANCQGQGDSSSCSDQGSVSESGITAAKDSKEEDAEEGNVCSSNYVAVKQEKTSDSCNSKPVEHESDGVSEAGTEAHEGNTASETKSPSPTAKQEHITPSSSPPTPNSEVTTPTLARRDSLSVHAKEFTPRNMIATSDPRSGTYPVGLNPNASPYLTNGGSQPPVKGDGGGDGGGDSSGDSSGDSGDGGKKSGGKTRAAVDGSSATAQSKVYIAYMYYVRICTCTCTCTCTMYNVYTCTMYNVYTCICVM